MLPIQFDSFKASKKEYEREGGKEKEKEKPRWFGREEEHRESVVLR
jgi:hypothetical protein